MSADSRLLIAGGTVFTGGESERVVPDGAVLVVDGRVAAAGPAREIEAAVAGSRDIARLDARGGLIMPGLVNAHTHLYSALARGLMADIEPSSSFVEILEHLWWRLDRALTNEHSWYSAAAGALDLIANGTTTIIDHHASQVHVTDSLANVSEALADVGIRANLCFEVTDRDGPEKRDEGLAENEAFARHVAEERASAGGEGLSSASVGLHASFTLDDETLDRSAALAQELGIGCHIHVAEDRADVDDSLKRSGRRVVERLHGHGILGERSVAVHSIHLSDAEFELLRDTDTIVVHNPQSNMNNAVGRSNVLRMLDEGILVGLGTDGFAASMFDEMKVANLIHRHDAGDPRVGHDIAMQLGIRNNPRIATRLIGDTVGVLEPGALADVIILDYDPPTPLVDGNFAGHLIFGLTGGMVNTVVVNGEIVLRDREFVAVDARATRARARELAQDLWRRM
ncbi:putative aminohydrolase SsnA [bacterium]|nr:putative aminohydrolase SsnA [bacterium]